MALEIKPNIRCLIDSWPLSEPSSSVSAAGFARLEVAGISGEEATVVGKVSADDRRLSLGAFDLDQFTSQALVTVTSAASAIHLSSIASWWEANPAFAMFAGSRIFLDACWVRFGWGTIGADRASFAIEVTL